MCVRRGGRPGAWRTMPVRTNLQPGYSVVLSRALFELARASQDIEGGWGRGGSRGIESLRLLCPAE